MAKFLTDEWVEEACACFAGLPDVPGASAIVQHVVTGAPEGTAEWCAVVVDGRTRACTSGKCDDAEVTVTVAYDAAVQMVRGELDPSVAFMQGRMKTAGDGGRLLAVLPLTATDEFRAARAALAAKTAV